MNKKIYISLLGDINNPLMEWNSYYCLETKKIDKIYRNYLKTNSLKYKLKESIGIFIKN